MPAPRKDFHLKSLLSPREFRLEDMAKKTLHPYMRPLVPSYKKKNFLKESDVILKFLCRSSLKRVRWSSDKEWIFINEERKPKKKSKTSGWMPKLYICVQPKYYWGVISDLIDLSHRFRFSWKFCKNFNHFGRPDKIVVYSQNLSDLKRILRLVRPLLNESHFHGLRFASDTVQSGLEKKGKGIYVGADPVFLKKVSWRYYRWAVNETIIKANLKNGRIDKNTRGALKVMNINLKHPGPLTLMPPQKNNKFIEEIWKEITA